MGKTCTKGNVIVEDVQIDDIHYEYDYGRCVKSKVITKPIRDNDGCWTWKSENIINSYIIDYAVNEKHSHYGPNLYDYEAYTGMKYI